jgi:hypothetical protein
VAGEICFNKCKVRVEGTISMRKLNIGLSDEQRAGVIELLNHDLADAYLLLIKPKSITGM